MTAVGRRTVVAATPRLERWARSGEGAGVGAESTRRITIFAGRQGDRAPRARTTSRTRALLIAEGPGTTITRSHADKFPGVIIN